MFVGITRSRALAALASTTSAASAIVLFLMGAWLARYIDQWPIEIRTVGEILTVSAVAAGMLGIVALTINGFARRL